jgi:hypothetical protein
VKFGKIIPGLCFMLLAGPAAQPAPAQNGERLRARHEARRQAAQKQRRENGPGKPNGEQRERAAVGLPPKWVENMRDMSPEERERFMQNNERFKSLPPQRQEQIRQNLQKWDAMPPEQQERIRATEDKLERATPEQREHFENDIVPKLQEMAPERRQRVLGHWRRLEGMTPAEQQAALHDPRFWGNLSPDEQSMVRDLNSIGIPPPQ